MYSLPFQRAGAVRAETLNSSCSHHHLHEEMSACTEQNTALIHHEQGEPGYQQRPLHGMKDPAHQQQGCSSTACTVALTACLHVPAGRSMLWQQLLKHWMKLAKTERNCVKRDRLGRGLHFHNHQTQQNLRSIVTVVNSLEQGVFLVTCLDRI